MGINSNGLTVNDAIAANRSFQTRASDSGTGPTGEDFGVKADPGANGTAGAKSQSTAKDSTSAGGQSSSKGAGTAASSGGTAPAQKTGPSAQTRNAQGSRGPARSQSTAAGSQPPPTAPNTDDDSSSNFGSVMATALGRSATSSADSTASTKTTASTDDSTGTSAVAAQPATTPTDAVAWIAQVMMAPGAVQAATATPDTATNPATDTAAGGRISAAGARTGGPTNIPAALGTADGDDEDATTAPATAQNAAAAAQSAAADKLKFNTDPVPANGSQVAGQATAQTTDAQAAATAAASTPDAANLNALADVQKMISGTAGTDAAATSASGASPAAPTTHGTTTDSADAAQAAAAAQVSSLNRAGAGLGTTTLTIQAPVGSAGFADEVTSKVTSLAQSGVTQAQLQLNPSDLGPVQVHITMQAGQASVWFGATHADTRAALEQSLPRLREMFAGAGLPLSDSGVFREAPQQQQAQSQSLATSGISRTTAAETTAGTSVTQIANVRLSLLDIYA